MKISCLVKINMFSFKENNLIVYTSRNMLSIIYILARLIVYIKYVTDGYLRRGTV